MSRLDSVIRRLRAQRACLRQGVELVRDLPGPIFELGFGQGRTYDHLREACPDREIFVFDRRPPADPSIAPDRDHLVLGDIRETLRAVAARFRGSVALVHSDVGTGDAALNARISASVAACLPALLGPGGMVVCDQPMDHERLEPSPLPREVKPGRYFMYRMGRGR